MFSGFRFAALLLPSCLLFSAALSPPGSPLDLSGRPVDPFHSKANVHVLLFVRTDCPITNRYAPELRRLADEFRSQAVDFWLVYPDAAETPANINSAIAQYHFPGTPVRDTRHLLVKEAHATIAPEAAVFTSRGLLAYHGRIDDLYVDIGKSRPSAQVHDLEDAINAVLAGHPVREPETRAVGCYLADVE